MTDTLSERKRVRKWLFLWNNLVYLPKVLSNTMIKDLFVNRHICQTIKIVENEKFLVDWQYIKNDKIYLVIFYYK